jgi:hypothetical protein
MGGEIEREFPLKMYEREFHGLGNRGTDTGCGQQFHGQARRDKSCCAIHCKPDAGANGRSIDEGSIPFTRSKPLNQPIESMYLSDCHQSENAKLRIKLRIAARDS